MDAYADIDLNTVKGLTEHQRNRIAQAQQSSRMDRVRASIINLCSGIQSTIRSIGGSQPYQPIGEGSNPRRYARLALLGTIGLLGLAGMLTLIASWMKGGGSGGGNSRVPQGPVLPRYKDPGCPALKAAPKGQRHIQIHNRCSFSVWPALLGQGGASFLKPEGGWEFKPGRCHTFTLPSSYPSLRLWGRTGCSEDFKCQSGGCVVNGDGACVSSGDVASLFEATLQANCNAAPGYGGPDYYDSSVVDGYNLGMSITLVGGEYVSNVAADMNCVNSVIRPFAVDLCPMELRLYSDQVPGTTTPTLSIDGKDTETSPCYTKPLDPKCRAKYAGCRSICKALDTGFIGYFIDHAQGNINVVDPYLTLWNGKRIRWSEQFLQGKKSCGIMGCRDSPAWGSYRQDEYNSSGKTMKNLVCCDGGFVNSPYQPNSQGQYPNACPTLGAGDPDSKFHSKMVGKDIAYPQKDQEIRLSSPWPDWPLSSLHENYAAIYKKASPNSYSWQYNDGSNSLAMCCGIEGGGPSYLITFCPDV